MSEKEPTVYQCSHCDFGSGRRGMDRCSKCDGFGSVFRVNGKVFFNTKEGYTAAKKELNP